MGNYGKFDLSQKQCCMVTLFSQHRKYIIIQSDNQTRNIWLTYMLVS